MPSATVPLVAAPPRDDAAARILLHRAQGTFQKWPEVFAGFRARVTVTSEARECAGWALVGARGDVHLDLADGALAAWARDTLALLVAERMPCFFKDGDGRFPITFDPRVSSDPLGRQVVVHRGAHGSPDIRYGVDERGRVRQRTTVEADGLHVRTYETFARATPGRILPLRRSTVVSEDGRILRRELVEDAHARVGHVWLPAEHRVQLSELDGTRVHRLRLHDHALV